MTTKKANEGVVSSISDSDLVMVASPTGQFQPISFENLMKAVLGGIQVGGRNLLLNSARQISNSDYVVSYYYLSDCVIPQAGDYLVITVWGQPGEGRSFYAYLNDGMGEYGYASLSKVGEGVYQCRCKVSKNLTEDWSGTPRVIFYQLPKTLTSISTIQCVKASYGNISTDWSPAPEDLRGGG